MIPLLKDVGTKLQNHNTRRPIAHWRCCQAGLPHFAHTSVARAGHGEQLAPAGSRAAQEIEAEAPSAELERV
jgi:hypothetical protein